MKACNVFKTKDYYKIITQSETEDGFLLSTLPVFLISVNCSNEELSDVILASLSKSKQNIKTPKRDEYPLLEKEIMSGIKEKSYTSLYKKSSSCDIRLEGGLLKIYPEKYFTEGKASDGLGWVEEDKIEILNVLIGRNKIAESLKVLLNSKYR